MQIEEGFRDVKSPQFGLGFGVHQSCQGKRIEILLLIAMLANVEVVQLDHFMLPEKWEASPVARQRLGWGAVTDCHRPVTTVMTD